MSLCTSLHDLLSDFINYGKMTENNEHKGGTSFENKEKEEQKEQDLSFLDAFIVSRKRNIDILYRKLEQIKKEMGEATQRLMPLRVDLSRCLYPEDREMVMEEIKSVDQIIQEDRAKFTLIHTKVRRLVAFVHKADLIQIQIAASHDSEDIRNLILLATEVVDDDLEKEVLLNMLNDKCMKNTCLNI